ncbi:adenosylmethionine decarboxylase [Gayadomonas joobiniege]|uniref:adenosylmethionine decarboxylase n=1 Tax=Gayadomonas joobiniege TaxID=1234606 RepID=UPI0003741D5A|nr:adenosylmethionine decarboxylase [Gayadomonas joobiniege]
MPIKLQGFNNLTKSLSISVYKVCWTASPKDSDRYIQKVDSQYSAEQLTQLLLGVVDMIGANILNIAQQNYQPQGASVTLMMSEASGVQVKPNINKVIQPTDLVAHLDKSHICVHTYPERDLEKGLNTFRIDLDVSTCGVISPLTALNYLLQSFAADIATIDYRVRGFTRDIRGKKLFIDHEINSIQNYISADLQSGYKMIDVNLAQENIFHTKMMRAPFNLERYLFRDSHTELTSAQHKNAADILQLEMQEIFYASNLV